MVQRYVQTLIPGFMLQDIYVLLDNHVFHDVRCHAALLISILQDCSQRLGSQRIQKITREN